MTDLNLQFSNAEERDKIKQFFTNPQSLDSTKTTVVVRTLKQEMLRSDTTNRRQVQMTDLNLQYSNAEERDKIKQFFTNPQSLDKTKKTVVFSTPLNQAAIESDLYRKWGEFRELF